MKLENEQVKLSLTGDPDVLGKLRAAGTLRRRKGTDLEVFEATYSSTPIEFTRNLRTGERSVHPFGADVAQSLVRSTRLVVGNPNDELAQALEVVGRYNLTSGDPVAADPLKCPFCGEQQTNARRFAYHVSQECKSPMAEVPKFNKANAADDADELQEQFRLPAPVASKPVAPKLPAQAGQAAVGGVAGAAKSAAVPPAPVTKSASPAAVAQGASSGEGQQS